MLEKNPGAVLNAPIFCVVFEYVPFMNVSAAGFAVVESVPFNSGTKTVEESKNNIHPDGAPGAPAAPVSGRGRCFRREISRQLQELAISGHRRSGLSHLERGRRRLVRRRGTKERRSVAQGLRRRALRGQAPGPRASGGARSIASAFPG